MSCSLILHPLRRPPQASIANAPVESHLGRKHVQWLRVGAPAGCRRRCVRACRLAAGCGSSCSLPCAWTPRQGIRAAQSMLLPIFLHRTAAGLKRLQLQARRIYGHSSHRNQGLVLCMGSGADLHRMQNTSQSSGAVADGLVGPGPASVGSEQGSRSRSTAMSGSGA